MWAFSDESERPGIDLFGLVLLSPKVAPEVRQELRGLCLPGQRRFHMSDESDRRRGLLLNAIGRSRRLKATVLRYRRPPGVGHVAARDALVEAAVNVVLQASVTTWTLDDMAPAGRARDRNVIGHALARSGAQVTFDHRRSYEEPLLWAADAVCWAVGAGPEWRRRVEPILTGVDIGP